LSFEWFQQFQSNIRRDLPLLKEQMDDSDAAEASSNGPACRRKNLALETVRLILK
jgi:hypothetical protein